MARRTATITVTQAGRDQGKVFLITEMSAVAAERWAVRCFLALAKSGAEVPPEIEQAGFAGLASLGAGNIAVMLLKMIGGLDHATAIQLLDDLMSCVQAIPEPSKPQVVRALVEDDTEEIATRFLLRQEAFKVHVDFSVVASLLKPAAGATTETAGTSLDTPTSPI